MSNKCFITKLPTTVKNDSLPIYGELIMHFGKNGSIRIDYKGDIPNKEIYSDANILYIKDAGTPQQSNYTGYNNSNIKRFKISTNNSVLTKSEADVHIPNKYNITFIDIITPISLPSGENPGTIGFDLSDIKYLTALTGIRVVDTSISGDISSLSNLTALTYIDLHNTSVSGDISSLSNLTALTTLNLTYTRINGDISAIVMNCTNLTRLSIPNSVKITDEQKKTLTDRGCTVTIV